MTRLPNTPMPDETGRGRAQDWAQQWKELEQRLIEDARVREPSGSDPKDAAKASRDSEAISIPVEPRAKEPALARIAEPQRELRPFARAAARAGRTLWRWTKAAAPLLIAFALGLGAGAVFLRPELPHGDASAQGAAQRGSRAVQPGADQAPVLKLDGDVATFGRHVDAPAPARREQGEVRR
jgi:hypothetical protein